MSQLHPAPLKYTNAYERINENLAANHVLCLCNLSSCQQSLQTRVLYTNMRWIITAAMKQHYVMQYLNCFIIICDFYFHSIVKGYIVRTEMFTSAAFPRDDWITLTVSGCHVTVIRALFSCFCNLIAWTLYMDWVYKIYTMNKRTGYGKDTN